MLCIEDLLATLHWVQNSVGGLDNMIKRSKNNLNAITNFVQQRDWIDFLADNAEIRSNTSVCLTLDLSETKIKEMTTLLAQEGIAYDINSYKSAPPGIRIWCGSTIETDDIERLLLWIDWAFKKIR